MAEETPMSPISEAVPPKSNPLATPTSAHAATLKLKPVIRRPTVGGAASAVPNALKPGLKLPPKPGLSTAGLKLPPKPGATPAGVKLPARPVIRKPGEAKPLPIVAPTAEKPAVPASAAEAPKTEAPKPLEALKAVTQNLKSLTSPIPQQAVLHKTGIIADTEMTEAQKQAAKSKTARISLSDAMGVAPVKNEALPMKTIRIKRPVDLPAAPSAAEPAANATSFTQRKTLKISRPGGATVRPAGKFGVKKPAATPPAESVEGESTDVADIPEMPSTPVAPVPMAMKDLVPDVPKGVAIAGLAVQIAACLTIAFLGWLLIQDAQLPLYAGGLGM